MSSCSRFAANRPCNFHSTFTMETEAAVKIETRQQFLIVLTIAVAALFVGERLIYEPLANWWSARSQSVATLRKQVSDGKMLLQREQTIRSRWAQMRTNTLSADTSLAEQQVLKAFDNWSQDSGAGITGITPQWNDDATNYVTVDWRVEAAGDLGSLTRFLYDIEQGPMALKVESVDVNARDDTGQQFTLGLQINGLALRPEAK